MKSVLQCFAEPGQAVFEAFFDDEIGGAVEAVGLGMTDLFPERELQHRKSTKPNHWHAVRSVVRVLHFEVLVVAIAAADIAKGVALTPTDADRICLAAGRIRAAIEACE